MNRTHAKWGSPESLVQDLRSSDNAIRSKAIQAIGVEDLTNFRADYFEEISLRYASFGEQTPGEYPVRNAIVEVVAGDRVMVAIAVPGPDDWERIVAFDGLRKYDVAPALNSFLTLELVNHEPPRAVIDLSVRPATEIVLRSVQGGTGVYVEAEDRFELEGHEIHHVLSFVRRKDAHVFAPEGGSLHERRWFEDGHLVEETATVKDNDFGDWKSTDERNFKSKTCTPYKWDTTNFRYAPAGPAKSCSARTP